jgi:lipopolysaccharide/colanic/teichoic acid biosynthesis glycosyltransferase
MKTYATEPQVVQEEVHHDSGRHVEPGAHQMDFVSLSADSAESKVTSTVQRLMDILGAGLALIVLLPMCVLVALAIKLDTPGPVLFVQTRVGKGGRLFPVYKFRSMVTNAHAMRHKLAEHNERNGPVFKIKKDPRITRVGRWLRRLSIDEVPQFLNVLLGHMSLVGPRPALPEEVAQYTPRQAMRLTVTPGLTGLWQVSGRSSLSFERSIDLDLEYIEKRSIGLNLRILLMTIPAVLGGRGAC